MGPLFLTMMLFNPDTLINLLNDQNIVVKEIAQQQLKFLKTEYPEILAGQLGDKSYKIRQEAFDKILKQIHDGNYDKRIQITKVLNKYKTAKDLEVRKRAVMLLQQISERILVITPKIEREEE